MKLGWPTTRAAPEEDDDDSAVIKEGNLLKEGGAPILRWQQRYVVLKHSGVARYDKAGASGEGGHTRPKYGAINHLPTCTVYPVIDTTLAGKPGQKAKQDSEADMVFVVKTESGRVFKFKAETENDRDEWVLAFLEAGTVAGPGVKRCARKVKEREKEKERELEREKRHQLKTADSSNDLADAVKPSPRHKHDEDPGAEKHEKEKQKEKEEPLPSPRGKILPSPRAENSPPNPQQADKGKKSPAHNEQQAAGSKEQKPSLHKNSRDEIKLNDPPPPLKEVDPDINDICNEISACLTVSGSFRDQWPKFNFPS